jgi:hypothetical protein
MLEQAAGDELLGCPHHVSEYFSHARDYSLWGCYTGSI